MSETISPGSSPVSVWEPLRPTLTAWRTSPARFVTECFGAAPEAWQAEALAAVAEDDRIAIRSGHGVGKSAFLAWLILWWMTTRFPAKIPCTAPTAHQLNDVLWSEIGKWHRKMAEPFRSWLHVGADRVSLVAAPKNSFAVARTARKEEPEAFQGFHEENLLFIVDEASGVPDIIFEVGEGSMTTAGAKTVMTGNPTQTTGYFHAAFHRSRAYWRTMRVGCEMSSQVSPDYPVRQAALYGVDSNVYRVRVQGEFPSADDDGVIPLHLCEAAVARDVMGTSAPVVWGLDVARFGDDRTALIKRKGNQVLEKAKTWRGKDTMQVAGLIKAEYEATPKALQPRGILVDVIGLGAGVVDRLREQNLPVRGVNVAEAPAVHDEKYLRLRDELWFQARDWFMARDCTMPEDDELVADLTGPKYKITSTGKIQVEAKAEMKKRGVISPDLADAFCLTFGPSDVAGKARPIAYPKEATRAIV